MLLTLDNVRQVLEEYGARAVEIYREQLTAGNKNASKQLLNSVQARVDIGNDSFEVLLSLEHYWKYVEGGAKGTESSYPGAIYPAHFPPPKVLENWILIKPVIPRPNDRGKIPTPKQLSWMIARSIERKGIKPYPALQNTIDELNKEYEGKFAVALQKDTAEYIAKIFVGLKGSMSQKI